MDAVSLGDRVVAYHRKRFPRCQPYEVVFKAVEELGEVAEEMLPQGDPGRAAQEAADVVLVLMVLCGRFLDADVLDLVERKLRLLNTPGAHSASLLEVSLD